MKVKVKICGITNLEDALAAVEAGADALGFVLYEGSPRRIVLRDVRSIVSKLPPFVAKVGVFVNAAPQAVAQAVAEAGLDTLQFHGDESPEYCHGFPPLQQPADALMQLPHPGRRHVVHMGAVNPLGDISDDLIAVRLFDKGATH